MSGAIAVMAERYRTDAVKLRQDMEGRGAVDRLRRSIRIDKALELILAQASVKMN